jgi:hypothetical protein
LRERLQKIGDPKSLTYSQFSELADELAEAKNAEANRWKKRIGSVTGAYQVQSVAEHGADEIVHTIRVEVGFHLHSLNSNPFRKKLRSLIGSTAICQRMRT